jgi:hypothetical protein
MAHLKRRKSGKYVEIKSVEKEGALTGARTQTLLNCFIVGKLSCVVSLVW